MLCGTATEAVFRTKAAVMSHGKCFQEQSRYDLDQPHTHLTLIVVCSEVFHMLETSRSCWLIQNPNSHDQELKKARTRCCTLFLPRYIRVHGSRFAFNNSLGFNGEESGLWRFPLTGIHSKNLFSKWILPSDMRLWCLSSEIDFSNNLIDITFVSNEEIQIVEDRAILVQGGLDYRE